MKFKTIGSVIFENNEYSSEYLRKYIDNIKKNIISAVNPNECIAVIVERNQYMLCLIMALIESNITFLPIDLELPEKRILYMLQNADIKTVITSEKKCIGADLTFKYLLLKSLLIDNNSNYLDIPFSEFNNPVYYLFTSGSTGNPKAVVVNVKGFFNFLESIPNIIEFSSGEKIASFTTISFDIFFLETILSLINGVTVVLANKDEQSNPKKMIDLLVNHKITILQSTPSRLKLLRMFDKNFESLRFLKILMVGGEIFPIELLKHLQQNLTAEIYNMYGPTETTIWSTISNLTHKQSVDIGKPIANTHIYLLNDRKELTESDKEGEICIAGDGLSNGYYKNQELTNNNFIQLPFEPYCKVYCTGDLGKYENGNLFCIGRIDNQVKINGYRIELEEIEYAIRKNNLVLDSVVCYDSDNNQLVSFYISDEKIDIESLIDELESILPNYMIPSVFEKVSYFNYTPSGKTDRKSMLEAFRNKITDSEMVISSNIDLQIISIIKTELQTNKEIKAETKLENLGLNSMKYISIIVSIEDVFEFEFEEDFLLQESFITVQNIIDYVKEKIK